MNGTFPRRKIAQIFQKFPGIAGFLHKVYRITQPRFTVGVVGVVANEQGQILLVEHVFHALPWGFPGGWINRGEDPAECARREIFEELALSVEIERLLLVRLTFPGHIDFAYLCRTTGQIGKLSPELFSYAWFDPDKLPRLVDFHALVVQKFLEERSKENHLTTASVSQVMSESEL